MVRVSSPAKLRPWSELTAKMVMGGGSWVGEEWLRARLRPPWSLRFCDAILVPPKLLIMQAPKHAQTSAGIASHEPCDSGELSRMRVSSRKTSQDYLVSLFLVFCSTKQYPPKNQAFFATCRTLSNLEKTREKKIKQGKSLLKINQRSLKTKERKDRVRVP